MVQSVLVSKVLDPPSQMTTPQDCNVTKTKGAMQLLLKKKDSSSKVSQHTAKEKESEDQSHRESPAVTRERGCLVN